MARPFKPTALHELAGNPGHRPLRNVPKPKAVLPEMPKGLRKAAKREWKFITEKLYALGLLTEIDGKALMMYVDAYADWQEAQRDCTKHGLVNEVPLLDKLNQPILLDGKMIMVRKENPAFNIKCKANKTMIVLLAKFGLSPVDREKLRAPDKSKNKNTEEEKELEWMPDSDSSVVQ